MSADGQIIVYQSEINGLITADQNSLKGIFAHDRQTGKTERLSKDWEGNEGVGDYEPAFNPYMLKDGSGVLYRSSINITPDSESWGWNLYTSTLPMCLSGNTAPIVQITAPTVPLTIATGSALEMSAQAIDNEDGDLSAQISWASSIDGNLGTGTTINVNLTEGVHIITATVIDNEGMIPDFETTLQVTVTQGGVQ